MHQFSCLEDHGLPGCASVKSNEPVFVFIEILCPDQMAQPERVIFARPRFSLLKTEIWANREPFVPPGVSFL
jgi:hypothetical protein